MISFLSLPIDLVVILCLSISTEAFVPVKTLSSSSESGHSLLSPRTILQAKVKRNKSSFAQKRKRRGKKFVNKPMERPKILDEVPQADSWEKTISTEDKVQTMKKEEEETKSKAAALIETQRKSVDVLGYIKERVQNLSMEEMDLTADSGFLFVEDNFLGSELSTEMLNEGISMFDSNKLELDLNAGITSGEFATAIKGGQDQYADCPRSVEYVVALTRHMAFQFNESGKQEEVGYKIDETVSIAGMRLFNRKARLSSIALLTGKEGDNDNVDLVEKAFGTVVDRDSDEIDLRKVTVIYFMAADGWDKSCGGGLTFKKEGVEDYFVEAKNDRLLVFSSEGSIHRMEPWTGKDGVDNFSSSIVTHLVRERQ